VTENSHLLWLALSDHGQGQSPEKHEGQGAGQQPTKRSREKTSKFAYASKSLTTYFEEGLKGAGGEIKSSGGQDLLNRM